MQEIYKNIYIETKFSGVVVGAIYTPHGLIFIDAPFRIEEVREWRNALSEIYGSTERILINLDTHLDRTLGVKSMDSAVIAQTNAVTMIKNRPNTSRAQEMDAGAMWESYDGLSNIRWVTPELIFEERLDLEWGEYRVILEHHIGGNAAGVWVNIPEAKVLFVGDSVVVDQPPFLAFADFDNWIEDLMLLTSTEYRNYTIIGGRNGIVSREDIQELLKFIRSLQRSLERISGKEKDTESLNRLAEKLTLHFENKKSIGDVFLNRLKWGLSAYYELHFQS
ncbi:MAG: hypothetical protein MUO40_14740 [Anaerolineaceae bacterium]|nr:hypothetical protein [Anaerolineaceae bacterium]